LNKTYQDNQPSRPMNLARKGLTDLVNSSIYMEEITLIPPKPLTTLLHSSQSSW